MAARSRRRPREAAPTDLLEDSPVVFSPLEQFSTASFILPIQSSTSTSSCGHNIVVPSNRRRLSAAGDGPYWLRRRTVMHHSPDSPTSEEEEDDESGRPFTAAETRWTQRKDYSAPHRRTDSQRRSTDHHPPAPSGISNEQMRKSFKEKLETFKAMERQASLTTSVNTAPSSSQAAKAKRQHSPLSSHRSLSRPNEPSQRASGDASKRNLFIEDELRCSSVDDSNQVSRLPDVPRTSPKRSVSSQASTSRQTARSKGPSATAPARIRNRIRRRQSSLASFANNSSDESDRRYSPPTADDDAIPCATCQALKLAEQSQAARDEMFRCVFDIQSKVIAMVRCLESAKALEVLYREKHPHAGELADDIRSMRKLTANETPRATHPTRFPTNAAASPSTTASSGGGAVTIFSRKSLGSAISAISTPIKDKLRRQTMDRSPLSCTQAAMFLRSQMSIPYGVDVAATEMVGSATPQLPAMTNEQSLMMQKKKLIQNAFRQPTPPSAAGDGGTLNNVGGDGGTMSVESPMAPSASPGVSATVEKSWNMSSPTTVGSPPNVYGEDRQAASPVMAESMSPQPRPWSTLLEATTSCSFMEETSPTPLRHPLAHLLTPSRSCGSKSVRSSSQLEVSDGGGNILLDLVLDQQELICQLSGFNDAIITEMKAVTDMIRPALQQGNEAAPPSAASTAEESESRSRASTGEKANSSSSSCLRHLNNSQKLAGLTGSSPITPKQHCIPT